MTKQEAEKIGELIADVSIKIGVLLHSAGTSKTLGEVKNECRQMAVERLCEVEK